MPDGREEYAAFLPGIGKLRSCLDGGSVNERSSRGVGRLTRSPDYASEHESLLLSFQTSGDPFDAQRRDACKTLMRILAASYDTGRPVGLR